MADPKITLSKPVSFNGETFTELTFTEPDVGCLVDAEAAGEGQQTQMFALLASMCGMPFDAFRRVKASDLKRIIAATDHLVKNFNQDDETTGETSPS